MITLQIILNLQTVKNLKIYHQNFYHFIKMSTVFLNHKIICAINDSIKQEQQSMLRLSALLNDDNKVLLDKFTTTSEHLIRIGLKTIAKLNAEVITSD